MMTIVWQRFVPLQGKYLNKATRRSILGSVFTNYNKEFWDKELRDRAERDNKEPKELEDLSKMMEDLDNIQSKRRTNRDWNSLLLTDPKKQPNGRNNPLPRDELANIENKILEKKIADKKKEELRKKNIAVSFVRKIEYIM